VGQWEIVGLGFLVGGLIGLTGVGGGVLMTPMLIIVFRVPPSIAVGTDLFCASLTKIAGAARHWRLENVDVHLAAALSAGSLPGSLCGIAAAKKVKDVMGAAVEPLISSVLAWVCIVVASIMMLRLVAGAWWPKGIRDEGDGAPSRRSRTWTVVLGAVTGLLVGLTSIGAGSIVMLFLATMYTMPARRLVGTDIFHAAILASVSALGHLWAGDVDFSLAALLLVGSVPGVLLGSRASIRIPDPALRASVALVLVFSGAKLLLR